MPILSLFRSNTRAMKPNKKKTATKARSTLENDENFNLLAPLLNRKSRASIENDSVTTTLNSNNQTSMFSDNIVPLTPSNSENSVLQSIANTAITLSVSNNANFESLTTNNILSSISPDNFRAVPTPIKASSPPLNDDNQTLEPPSDFNVTATPPVSHALIQSSNNNNPTGRRITSNVWLYATKSDDGKSATCKICNFTCTTSAHSTSAIRHHLIRRHNKLDLVITAQQVPRTQSSISEVYKRQLHDLCYKAIVIDHRPFNDLRKKGILAVFNKMCPGKSSAFHSINT